MQLGMGPQPKRRRRHSPPPLIFPTVLPSAMISPRRAIIMPRRLRRSGCLAWRTLRRTRHLARLILRTAFVHPHVRLTILIRPIVHAHIRLTILIGPILHLAGPAIVIRTIRWAIRVAAIFRR